jgi:hypothetical protein
MDDTIGNDAEEKAVVVNFKVQSRHVTGTEENHEHLPWQ